MLQQQKKYLIIIALTLGIFTLSYIATVRYQIVPRVNEPATSKVNDAKTDDVKFKDDKTKYFFLRSTKTSSLFDEFRTKDSQRERKSQQSSSDETTRLGNRHNHDSTLAKTSSQVDSTYLSKNKTLACDKLDLLTKPPKRYFGRYGIVKDPNKVPEYSEEDVDKRMKIRRQKLQQYCSTLDLDPRKRTQRIKEASIYIDRKNKYLFCPHGKVASSTWFAMFLSITGYIPYNHSSLYNSKIWGMQEVHQRLQIENGNGNFVHNTYLTPYKGDFDEVVKSYRKWLVVRHPLEILASAYRNKVVDDIRYPLRKRIISHRIPGESYEDIPSFAETVDYRCDPLSRHFHDSHWDDYLHHCAPCDIEYEYIAHYETVIEDAKYIFSQVNFPYKEFPKRIRSDPGRINLTLPTSDKTLEKYVQGLGKKRLQKLYNLYRHDLHMFGYINC